TPRNDPWLECIAKNGAGSEECAQISSIPNIPCEEITRCTSAEELALSLRPRPKRQYQPTLGSVWDQLIDIFIGSPLAFALLVDDVMSESFWRAVITLAQLAAGFSIATTMLRRPLSWFSTRLAGGGLFGACLAITAWVAAGLAGATVLSIPILWTVDLI